MKRLLSMLLITSFIALPTGFAATKKIAVKELKLVTQIPYSDDVAGIIVTGKTIVLFGTRSEKSFVRAVDTSGQELWNIALEPATSSIATAAVADKAGNIWVAGSISLLQAAITPTPTPSVAPLNPDNVTVTPEVFIADLNTVALWKIPLGASSATLFTFQQKSPVLITTMAQDTNGISLAGITQTQKGSSGFVISANLLGEFGNAILIGGVATILDAVVRHGDESLTLTGASGETLGGKKLEGTVDGVIIRLSKTGKVTSVVRSSALKSSRNWISATPTLLLGGEVITGTRIESAITKFSSKYVPKWSYRFLSTGPTFTVGSNYAFFASTGPIPALSGWAPKKARPLLLTFDAAGVITGAHSAPVDQSEVIAAQYSKDFGLFCVTSNSETISIYTLT